MTIKRQMFISNIRTVLVTIFGLFFVSFMLRIVMGGIMGISFEEERAQREIARQEMARQEIENGYPTTIPNHQYQYDHQDGHRIFGPLSIVFFVALNIAFISLINNLLNYRLVKNIIRPLQPLGEGVAQIHNNNLSFRISYQNDDEYRPICDAFNEMAARLEESAAQKRQDEANRRKLLAGISHDLRTPLTSIKGYLEGLETGVASTAEIREQYFAAIKNKAVDMEYIIERLFLFSKLDMNEFPLTLRRVSLTPVISDMIEEVAREYDQRGLTIHCAETRRDEFVLVDTLWLHNVLINILENSVRYKKTDRASMEISADKVNNAVFLRFADNGPGVPTEALPKLFDVFYRADPSRNIKGSGLGLAISKKIIERMGGDIHAELPKDGGLAVIIRLPIVEDK